MIAVTLNVTEPASGPVVAPTSIPLNSPATLTGTFTLTAGPLPATFTAAPELTWLSVSATAGALLPGAKPDELPLPQIPRRSYPAAAAYSSKITVVTMSNGLATTQTVTVPLYCESSDAHDNR